MKFLFAAFIFILALGLNSKTVAAEHTEAAATCNAGQTEHCAPTSTHENSHENKSAEMNSLFPEKQKNALQSDRPTVVKLVAPQFLTKVAGTSTKLEWTAVDGATNYHLQVATDPNFKWLMTNDQWVKTTSFDMTQLEPGKKYFWRVAAVKSDNDSMFTKSLFVSSAFSTK